MAKPKGDVVLTIELPQSLYASRQASGSAKESDTLREGEWSPLLQQLLVQEETLDIRWYRAEDSALGLQEHLQIAATAQELADDRLTRTPGYAERSAYLCIACMDLREV